MESITGAYPSNLEATQFISSSPFGHCSLPSQRVAFETHTPLSLQSNASSGHLLPRKFFFCITHSSSDASLQSARPSHTKYQLIQCPLDRHWNVFLGHPEYSAPQACVASFGYLQSHRLASLQCVYGSANWHCRSKWQRKPNEIGPSPKSTRVRISTNTTSYLNQFFRIICHFCFINSSYLGI